MKKLTLSVRFFTLGVVFTLRVATELGAIYIPLAFFFFENVKFLVEFLRNKQLLFLNQSVSRNSKYNSLFRVFFLIAILFLSQHPWNLLSLGFVRFVS